MSFEFGLLCREHTERRRHGTDEAGGYQVVAEKKEGPQPADRAAELVIEYEHVQDRFSEVRIECRERCAEFGEVGCD